MEIIKTGINGLVLLKPRIFKDERGEFHEFYRKTLDEAIGVSAGFVQENVSVSQKGVLRGLHFQVNTPQGKLVSCLKGSIFDVVVDLRPNSGTFGEHYTVELNSVTRQQLYVPEGFAHGFYTLSDDAIVHYKCTSYYDPSDESGIRWDDSELNISWPVGDKKLSPKDDILKTLAVEKEALIAKWQNL